VPQGQFAEGRELLGAFDDRQEMIAREPAGLAGKANRA